ncbi:MAG: hypothetical protein JWO60_124, partial [Frankiales bacterium]|nr:hypothetical protein [Frankiales bacterium]
MTDALCAPRSGRGRVALALALALGAGPLATSALATSAPTTSAPAALVGRGQPDAGSVGNADGRTPG